MKVIFLKDHEKHEKGDLAEVKSGFGRNFLIPKGFAVFADKNAVLNWEKEKEAREEKKRKQEQETVKIIEKINDTDFVFKVKTGDGGKAFGSVTKEDVVKQLKEKIGFDIKKQQIELENIKETGVFEAKVNLGKNKTASFMVNVEKE